MEKINFENLPSTNTPINASNLNTLQNNVENAFKNEYSESQTDTYSCDYVNNVASDLEELINTTSTNLTTSINNKENKPTRSAGSINLVNNRPYLIACKPFTTVTASGGIGVVLGGQDIYWIISNNITSSRSGTKYTLSSSLGSVYIIAIPIQ